ncbi:VOC family protein, partial [Leisingera sp. F5]
MSDPISKGFRLAHTMMRVMDMEKSLEFYCGILGMEVLRRTDYPEGKFTNTFIGYGPEAESPALELTANWDQEEPYDKGNGWGHICIETPDVYAACEQLAAAGVKITRPPGP